MGLFDAFTKLFGGASGSEGETPRAETWAVRVFDASGDVESERTLTEGDEIKIGRSGQDLSLSAEGVSRLHALLRVESGMLHVESLGGEIAVDGRTGGRHSITGAASMQIGPYRLDLRPAADGANVAGSSRAPASPANRTTTLEQIAERLGAKLVTRTDDSDRRTRELQLIVAGSPARLIFGSSSELVQVEVKADNKRGMLCVTHEPGSKPAASSPDDPWAAPDSRRFLAHEIYVREDFVPVLDSLPDDAIAAIVEFVQRHRIMHVLALPEEFQVTPFDPLKPDDDVIDDVLRFTESFVRLFADGDGWVGLEPGIYVDGAKVDPGGIAPTVDCSYCGTLVKLNEHSACPNCGAPLARDTV